MFGALVYALFGVRLFLSSVASLAVTIRELIPREGSGGLGAVSVGLTAILFPYTLLALATGVVWGVSFVLTAVLLGLYALRTSSGSR